MAGQEFGDISGEVDRIAAEGSPKRVGGQATTKDDDAMPASANVLFQAEKRNYDRDVQLWYNYRLKLRRASSGPHPGRRNGARSTTRAPG